MGAKSRSKSVYEREIEDIAKTLAVELSRDPDWQLVTGKVIPDTNEEFERCRRSLSRLTKKATQLLCPGSRVSCVYGRGTAHHWIHLEVTTQECPASLQFNGRTEPVYVEGKIEDILCALGFRYGTYTSDSGPGNAEPGRCIRVEVRYR